MRRFVVLLNPRAAQEIDDAARWWAERGSPGLIDNAIARPSASPWSASGINGDSRPTSDQARQIASSHTSAPAAVSAIAA
jgi:hypothetical protein